MGRRSPSPPLSPEPGSTGSSSTATATCAPQYGRRGRAQPHGDRTVDDHLSRRSLLADNVNLHETNRRLSQRIADLESRLSELLGEQTFARTGLGAARDHAALEAKITELQQQALDHRQALEEHDEELAAAREAHRRLMTEINRLTTNDQGSRV